MSNQKRKRKFISTVTYGENDRRLSSFITTLQEELRCLQDTRELTAKQIAATCRQSERASKKAEYFHNSDVLSSQAKADFIEVNAQAGCVLPNIDPDLLSIARDFIHHALEKYTRRETQSSGEVLDLGHLLSLWGYGPGASRGTDSTHFVEKVQEKNPSVTLRAKRLADMLRRLNPHLWTFDGRTGCEFNIVRGSSLSTVPKNKDKHRTICTEPLMNMALQLAGGRYITGALKCIGLDISIQQKLNKLLAEFGSSDGALATLDLKSASDLITVLLIKLLWPTAWFEFFSITRSEECEVEKGRWVGLNMMGTMGNGFTFPMMTLTLLALVYAVQSVRLLKPYYVDYKTTAVFGDDIIVPVDDYEEVVKILSAAGLVVNLDKSFTFVGERLLPIYKSFVAGGFRESCGGDFLLGYNITPFYVVSLSSDAHVYITINKLLEWQVKHGLFLFKTFEFLVSLLHKCKPFFVPIYESPFAGIRCGLVSGSYRKLKVVDSSVKHKASSVNPSAFVLMYTAGFIESAGDDRFSYTRRARRPPSVSESDRIIDSAQYEPVLARLPNGFLDGGCDVLRCSDENKTINTFLRIADSTM